MSADGKVMSAEVTPGTIFSAQPAKPLFPLPQEYLRAPGAVMIDMLPDASRFLFPLPPREAPRNDLEVILSWQ